MRIPAALQTIEMNWLPNPIERRLEYRLVLPTWYAWLLVKVIRPHERELPAIVNRIGRMVARIAGARIEFRERRPEPLKEYMGLDNLITTGYAIAGKGVSIQEAAREGLPVREWRW
jgi:hypothetical protein